MAKYPKVNFECCAKVNLARCCWCVPLRTGCMTLSIVGILASFGILVLDRGWVGIQSTINGCMANGIFLYGSVKQIKQPLMAYLLIDAIQIATMFSAGVYSFAMMSNIEETDGCNGDEAKELCKKTNIVVGCGFWALACMYVYFWICALSLYNNVCQQYIQNETTTNEQARRQSMASIASTASIKSSSSTNPLLSRVQSEGRNNSSGSISPLLARIQNEGRKDSSGSIKSFLSR